MVLPAEHYPSNLGNSQLISEHYIKPEESKKEELPQRHFVENITLEGEKAVMLSN